MTLHSTLNAFLFLAGSALCASGPCQAQQDRETVAPYDLLLTGGRVMDGSGNPWFRADVAVRDGRIVAVGRLAEHPTSRTLDVSGRIVAPGFIDLHSHAGGGLGSADAERRAAPNIVSQGITTVVVNQDGRSPASIKAQGERFDERGIGPNALLMVGHGTVRQRVMGSDHRRPATAAEIDAMRALVREAMADGASGMSAGLEYVPGRWSTTEEMVALVGELAPHGVYIVHERSSGADPMWFLPSQDPPGPPTMLDNILELVEVSERTGVVTVASHIKVKGANFWGSSGALIQLIDTARDRGVRIYADQYPYNTSGTDGNVVLIPGWLRRRVQGGSPAETLEQALRDPSVTADLERDMLHEIARRGGPEQLIIMDHPDRSFIGKSLGALARDHGVPPLQMAVQLQVSGDRQRRGGARIRGYSMSEMDLEALASQNWTATSTDGGIALPGDGSVHPRYYGAFPRKIRHYAMNRGVLTVEDAVRSCSSLPAQILGLPDRGWIRPGNHADLVVIDLEELQDVATAFEPHQHSRGVDYVMVGGQFVVEDGELTGALPGKLIHLER